MMPMWFHICNKLTQSANENEYLHFFRSQTHAKRLLNFAGMHRDAPKKYNSINEILLGKEI